MKSDWFLYDSSTSVFKRLAVPLLLLLLVSACGGGGAGEDPVTVTIPRGSGLGAVSDTLAQRDIIQWPFAFRMYARMRGADRTIKPGTYHIEPGQSWSAILDKLVRGEVVTYQFTIPEGWTTRQIAGRLAQITEVPEDSVLRLLNSSEAVERYGVPGPTLEGYLYPATYRVPLGTDLNSLLRTLTDTYKRAWNTEMRERADSIGLDEREVVTLASIIEAEARVWRERDTISAVYHNRLRRGMRLQADPTVQYALGERQSRLLYAHIDDVADHPYNTYRRDGLPPGPIGSPSRDALIAALYPADVDFLFFVARPDGTHIFTRTFAEHNRARREVAPAWEQYRQRVAEAAAGR